MSNSKNTEKKPAVLVVDDERGILSMIEAYLTSANIRSFLASSVEEAFECLEKVPIDVLVVDWRIGNRYGADVIETARNHNPLLPVIVISGQTTIDVETEALLAGADNFLHKPFSGTLLVRVVSLWLKRIERMSGSYFPTKAEDIIPFDRLKQKYFSLAVELAGSVNRASELLDVDRQTVSAVIKKSATADSD